MFSISFISKKSPYFSIATITLDTFSELIEVPTDYWSEQQYESQWREAVRAIIDGNTVSKAMLMASMHPPESANFFMCWTLYRQAKEVLIRNNMLFLDQLSQEFDENNIQDSVPTYEINNNDEKISEWRVAVADLEAWLSNSENDR